jgi:hypothetical protein
MSVRTWEQRSDLAQCFAPHLVLFPEQQERSRPGKQTGNIGDYHPRGIGPLLENSQLSSGLLRPRRAATLAALAASVRAKDELLILGKLIPNPNLAWQSYFKILNSIGPGGRAGRDRFPLTVYARLQTRGESNAASKVAANIGRDYPVSDQEIGRPFFQADSQPNEDDLSIQYWFCYYYDDWANQHEGDWEGICVFLRSTTAGYEPVGASYYAHETGIRRHWAEVDRSVMSGTHPFVFAAAGSHASYFQFVNGGYVVTVPGPIIPVVNLRLRVSVSSTRVDYVPDRNQYKSIEPYVEVLPDPIGPADPDHPIWQHRQWLNFRGSWGARALVGLAYGGPTGPSHKGLKWHNPFVWMERYCVPDYFVY